jgi:hypothetical protein
LRNTSVVGIDKVAVGEMLSLYDFDNPRLCMNEDPRNFLQNLRRGIRGAAKSSFGGGGSQASKQKQSSLRSKQTTNKQSWLHELISLFVCS